jgi:adenylate cyclase
LREAGSDCPLRTSGSLIGPTEVNIRGRSGSLNIWFWRSDRAASL